MSTGIDREIGRAPAEGNGWALGVDASTSPTPAVRGRRPGRVGWTGSEEGMGFAQLLGVFSVGLGLAQVITPRGVARLAGIDPSRRTVTVMRLAGLREIGHGVGILTNPRSKEWVGTRIAGDILDLALLGGALATGTRHPQRTALATAAVLGVTALDVMCTEELSESRKAPDRSLMDEPGIPVLKSITVDLPRAEVYRFWRDVENLPRFMPMVESVRDLGGGRSRWETDGPSGSPVVWESELTEERENELIAWRASGSGSPYLSGSVRFRDAPGDRGTIVTFEMHYSAPGGRLGAALLKLGRKEPGQQANDALRRMKQILETGEVVHSNATAASGPHPARWSVRNTTI